METKTLIAYFSATGTTKARAEKLEEILQADVYEIEPDLAYSKEDLDWKNKESRSSLEMKDQKARPKIKGKAPDFSAYDRILLGFPIWWGQSPRIILSFLDQLDLKSLDLYPFATSGASPIEPAVDSLREIYGDEAIKPGLLLNIDPEAGDLDPWLK